MVTTPSDLPDSIEGQGLESPDFLAWFGGTPPTLNTVRTVECLTKTRPTLAGVLVERLLTSPSSVDVLIHTLGILSSNSAVGDTVGVVSAIVDLLPHLDPLAIQDPHYGELVGRVFSVLADRAPSKLLEVAAPYLYTNLGLEESRLWGSIAHAVNSCPSPVEPELAAAIVKRWRALLLPEAEEHCSNVPGILATLLGLQLSLNVDCRMTLTELRESEFERRTLFQYFRSTH